MSEALRGKQKSCISIYLGVRKVEMGLLNVAYNEGWSGCSGVANERVQCLLEGNRMWRYEMSLYAVVFETL